VYGENSDRIETEICSTSLSGCTKPEVMQVLMRNAAPGSDGVNPVREDKPSEIIVAGISAGKVFHIVDKENNRVINITAPGHVFADGFVIRSVVERDGKISIRSFGEGVNQGSVSRALNIFAGGIAFQSLDRRIRRQTLKKSKEGRKTLFFERLNKTLGNL